MTWKLGNLVQLVRERNSEQEQALLRVFFAIFIFIFMFSRFNAGNSSSTQDVVFFFSGSFLIFSITLLAIVFFRPDSSEKRQPLAIIADLGATTFVMLMTEEIGTLFYGLYLWIIVGNGLRYGTKLLVMAHRFGVLGFVVVILFNDYWRIHKYFAIGLLLTLILIPLYIYKLLERLNQAIRRAEE